MGPISNQINRGKKKLQNNKRELGREALVGAAAGGLGAALGGGVENHLAANRLSNNRMGHAAAVGDKRFRAPMPSLKALGKRSGRAALTGAVAGPAMYFASDMLTSDKEEEPGAKEDGYFSSAVAGAGLGASGALGGMLSRDAYRHGDIFKALGSKAEPSRTDLKIKKKQMRRLGDITPVKRLGKVTGIGALLGGLAGLGYSAYKNSGSSHPKKNEVENTISSDNIRGSDGPLNTVPTNTPDMGPLVTGANPTAK